MGVSNIKRLSILLFICILIGCGRGTEVVNAPSIDEAAKPLSFSSQDYHIDLILPPHWTFIQYGPGEKIGPEAFQDPIDPKTSVVATLSRKTKSSQITITILYTRLAAGEKAIDFARLRHPNEVVEDIPMTDNSGQPIPNASGAGVYRENPDGSQVTDFYLSEDGIQLVWFHTEFNGSESDKPQINQDIQSIVDSIKV